MNALTFALYGLFMGVLAALWCGGVFIFQHTTLRLMLWFKGYTPRPGKFGRFLDYAVRRIFLQRVGGGYIFMHRYLQEHFAALYASPTIHSEVSARWADPTGDGVPFQN